MMVLHYVSQILRQVVPLVEHPSEQFLASLEEDLVKLVMKHGQMVRVCVWWVLCCDWCDGMMLRLSRAVFIVWELW